MTDKEWKELWNYAEKRNVLVRVLNYNIKDCDKECFVVGGCFFCKNGNIECSCCSDILADNRTPAQMKAIIENLL